MGPLSLTVASGDSHCWSPDGSGDSPQLTRTLAQLGVPPRPGPQPAQQTSTAHPAAAHQAGSRTPGWLIAAAAALAAAALACTMLRHRTPATVHDSEPGTALCLARAEVTRLGLPPRAGTRLVQRYGDDWREAVRMIRADPSLGDPVASTLPVLGVEVNLARSREMALTDEDVFVRRPW